MTRDRCSVLDPAGRVDMSVTDRPTVLWLRGEHDLSTVAELSEVMAAAIARADGNLVVDLSDVDFMDASTVGVVDRARVVLAARSRTMTLRSPSTRAQRVLDVCGLRWVVGTAGSAVRPRDELAGSSSRGP